MFEAVPVGDCLSFRLLDPEEIFIDSISGSLSPSPLFSNFFKMNQNRQQQEWIS